MKFDERYKNYGLWLSILSLIGLICSNFKLIDLGQYKEYVDVFLSILTYLGIISNPKEGTGYRDE